MGERVNSKAEQVYGELKEAILVGALEPGAPIDKLALCERLGVSRFPVSAAISRLAFEQPGGDRAAARLVRRAHLGRPKCASGCSSAARSNARSPPRRRAGCRRTASTALADNLRAVSEAVEAGDRPAFLCAGRRFPPGADDRISACAASQRGARRPALASGAGAAAADAAGRAQSRDARRAHAAIAAAIARGDVGRGASGDGAASAP